MPLSAIVSTSWPPGYKTRPLRSLSLSCFHLDLPFLMAPPASVTDVTDKLAQSFEETALAPDSIELPVPTILKGKSDEELKIIRSKATRKLE